MDKVRRLAAHDIIFPDGTQKVLGVVEIVGGKVNRVYPLEGEQARTEWVAGTIELRAAPDGSLTAYKNNQKL